MTESIKQEIINNIFENGDKLITGPILQTVLIDMIDDVNVKDQAILSKTGSWDEAVTQIPNLATKAEVTNLSESVARDLENVDVDLTGYATEQWVQNQGYLTEHQDISGLATKTELNAAKDNLQGNITSLSESVARDIANVSVPEGVATEAWVQSQDYASKSYVDNAVSSSSVDLTGYATETWVQNQGYLTEHQDISGLATKGELNDTKSTLESNLNNLSSSVSNDIQNKGEEVKTWVQSQGYLTEHQDISGLATKTELTSVSESVQTDITNLSESVANSAVWKKGTGEDSIVQKLTGANEANTSVASGVGAVAIGSQTTASGLYSHAEGWMTQASGDYSHAEGILTTASNNSHAEGYGTNASGLASHAEGWTTRASGSYSHAEGSSTIASAHWSHAEGGDTKASGSYSHAEGIYTVALGQASHTEGFRTTASKEGSHAEGESTIASGSYSHAEGGYTLTSNQYEHAQGQYNHNSTNQIFSVGAGEKIGETVTRRNAVSILEVPNSDTQVVTASFFVQNIGGYDGTNPLPGTNDLATVVSKVSSIWEKGTGTNSIVQVLSGDNEANKPTATGTGALALGFATTASGDNSHAEGNSTNASGYYTHTEGSFTTATGWNSHAEGDHTTATAHCSHAEGNATTASAGTSHAEGSDTLTLGWCGHAEGQFTTASVHCSHAEGHKAEASGSWSHAEGNGTRTLEQCSHAEGNTTLTLGSYSHAEGNYTTASGDNSHAEGDNTKALGNCSHAEGDNTIASNNHEHAQGRYNHNSENQIFSIGTGNNPNDRRNAVSVLEVSNSGSYTSSFFIQNIGGYDGTNPTPGTNDLATVINGLSSGGGSSETLWKKGTGQDSIVQTLTGADEANTPTATGIGSIATGYATTASGIDSHAEGDSTNASGDYSHAEGLYTTAFGQASHAEGDHTNAFGDYSHAEGYQTEAPNSYECALGMCNHSSEGQIFSVGAGEGDPDNPFDPKPITRRNAISVLAVPNSDTQVVTASFFVQNIGGYDGTNPTPGTNDLATVINGMSTGGGSSETLWKKGTGQDSIVQILTGDNETKTPTATGTGSIAIGFATTASGDWSHAEGVRTTANNYGSHAEGHYTTASNYYSHAEGEYTIASGYQSHAEGYFTIASNASEHAQGQYNHNSENQIFSIGTGNSNTDRRNAVSVLAVSNNNSYTSSFFVQNVGGYDGTNPIPGTNDLATVLNNTETWTFTLEDGSTVTKNVRIS